MEDIQWRNTALHPKLGPIDAICAIIILLAVLPIAVWKIIIAFLAVIFFWGLNQRNINLTAFLRMIRFFIAGKVRVKVNPRIWRRRCRI